MVLNEDLCGRRDLHRNQCEGVGLEDRLPPLWAIHAKVVAWNPTRPWVFLSGGVLSPEDALLKIGVPPKMIRLPVGFP